MGQRILITGAARGIRAESARRRAARGGAAASAPTGAGGVAALRELAAR
jgi:hypothetical protein